MNFSGISRQSFIGTLLRLPLALIPKSAQVPILQGVLRGRWWIAGSSTHGCWLGSYEFDKQQQLISHVQRGNVFYDIGAHVGFYTLLAAHLVGQQGHVYSFEPLPQNLQFLRKHIAMNHFSNVKVFDAAVGKESGVGHFKIAQSTSMGSLDSHGELSVAIVAIDELIAQGKLLPPTVLKIDVEGAEYMVLQGAMQTLKIHKPLIFLATHGHEVHAQCLELLRQLGYELKSLDNRSIENTDELLAQFPSKSTQ